MERRPKNHPEQGSLCFSPLYLRKANGTPFLLELWQKALIGFSPLYLRKANGTWNKLAETCGNFMFQSSLSEESKWNLLQRRMKKLTEFMFQSSLSEESKWNAILKNSI